MKQSKLWNVENVVPMGMFGALAAVPMVFELPLPFIAPSFYGLDLNKIPVLMSTFSMGPLAGVMVELVKMLAKLLIKPTSTGFAGELANFCFGYSMILPVGWTYRVDRTKGGTIIGMAVGTVSVAVAGIVGNTLVMLPFYSNFMPLDTVIAAGAAINPATSDVWTFAVICVRPSNLIRGFVVSLIAALVYRRISIVIHMSHPLGKKQVKE